MDDYRLTPDGIQARQATRAERELLARAQGQMLQLRAPRLLAGPDDRLYVAAMDGTGNSLYRDALESQTIVAHLNERIEALRHPAMAIGYVEGVGTQAGFLTSVADAARATTFKARVEEAYLLFCEQSAAWIREDPNVRIHLVGIGFSRGAEAVAALQRTIHERGIRDPVGADPSYDSDGILTRITWADRPPLVPPGQTLQVATLIDPVASGLRDQDRRLPPSNIGLLQFTSIHEPRDQFTATLHAPIGLSEQGRVANLLVPGVHSDAAGAYRIDGTGRIVRNMAVDYLNQVFGEPLLQKAPEPLDPRMYVVHASDQHLYGLWPKGRYLRSGERGMHTDLAPTCGVSAIDTCTRAPVDYRLADTVDWRHVERGPTPGGSDAKMDAAMASIRDMHARHPGRLERVAAHSRAPLRAQALEASQDIGDLFDRLADAARRGDLPGMSAVVRVFVETPAGRPFKPVHDVARTWSEVQRQQGVAELPQLASPEPGPSQHLRAAPVVQHP